MTIPTCFGDAADFALDFVKQVARKVKAHGRFFVRQAFFNTPRQGRHEVGFLGAGAMVVVAHGIEQATLVGIGHAGAGVVEGAIDRGQKFGAVEMNGIKRAGFDQRFDRALVQALTIHTTAEIEQALERPHFAAVGAFAATFAGRHDGFDGLLARAFDGTQSVANRLVGDGLEAVSTAVDVRWLETDAHFERVFVQDLELVGVVHLHRHVGAEEFGGVVHLEPGGVIGQ